MVTIVAEIIAAAVEANIVEVRNAIAAAAAAAAAKAVEEANNIRFANALGL